jgi:Fanconi-associated nuclease 1
MHIFTVLFFSILFLPVPGAFETPYQTGPMDLGHDTFFSARRKEIEERLEEIERGESERIVREIYELEKDTWALGARWDLFTVEDISEIVQVCFVRVLLA